MKNLKDIIEHEILRGEFKEAKYKNLLSAYKENLKCRRYDCKIFFDFRNVAMFFARYQKDKERFFAGLMHDIKSPLMSINYALKNNHKSEIANDIYYTNLESLNLIENVLTLYEENKETKFSKFDFLKIFDKVLKNHKYLILEKGLEIIFDYKENEIMITSCPVCLERILSNLISNAVKYSPKNNKILIELEKTNNLIIFSLSNKIERKKISYRPGGFGLYISKLLAKKIRGKIAHKKQGDKIKYILSFSSLQEEECS